MLRLFVFAMLTVGSLCFALKAPADEGEVLAKIGDEEVTLAAFSKQNPGLVSWFGMGVKSEQVQSALEGMVFYSVLALEARRQDLEDKPDVARQIDRLLANALLKQEMPPEKLAVEESDLKRYYQENLDQYKDSVKVGVAHILVSTLGEANTIQRALKAGQSFEALARASSIDTASSRLGGSLGQIPPEKLTPELQAAVQKLRPGEVSDVIKSKFGYHLVKVTSKPAASYKPYDQVASEISAKVIQEKRQNIAAQLKKKLWAKYDVTIDQAKLAELAEGTEAKRKQAKLAAATEPAESGSQPRLRLISEAYDLGRLSLKPVIQTSLLVNDGDADVLIRGVSSNCGCLTGAIKPKRLAPGEVGRLTVTFNPSLLSQAGPVTKILIIDSNDVDRQQRYVEFSANLIKK